MRPCPRCGHLPVQIEDPGPLPRLNEARVEACAFCGGALTEPWLKYCSTRCWNAARRGDGGDPEGAGERFKGEPREPRVHRVAPHS